MPDLIYSIRFNGRSFPVSHHFFFHLILAPMSNPSPSWARCRTLLMIAERGSDLTTATQGHLFYCSKTRVACSGVISCPTTVTPTSPPPRQPVPGSCIAILPCSLEVVVYYLRGPHSPTWNILQVGGPLSPSLLIGAPHTSDSHHSSLPFVKWRERDSLLGTLLQDAVTEQG